MKFEKNFLLMHQDALAMLDGKPLQTRAQNAGVLYDREGRHLLLPSLGLTHLIPSDTLNRPDSMGWWQFLTFLHYLNLADGTMPSGTQIPFSLMPGGMVRGGEFDRRSARTLEQILKEKTETEIRDLFQTIGGREICGKADCSFTLPYFPNFPLYVNIWFADEEFPHSARLLLDSTAPHYLTIEDVVTIGEHLLEVLMGCD